MGLLGDAVKITAENLEKLIELQTTIYAQRSVMAKGKELAASKTIEASRTALADLNGQLSEQRGVVEDVERDIKRLESDVELVEKRLEKDQERLNQSSNPKDIAGIEHEIESLRARLSSLEDSELELMEQRDTAAAQLADLEQRRVESEQELEKTKADITTELEALKNENSELLAKIETLKTQLPTELAELFEKKLARGAAVGRLVGSSCSACNMSLNSTAMAEINRVPADELATCSECSAILVRT